MEKEKEKNRHMNRGYTVLEHNMTFLWFSVEYKWVHVKGEMTCFEMINKFVNSCKPQLIKNNVIHINKYHLIQHEFKF